MSEQLEVTPGDSPREGVIIVGDGRCLAFSGWTELAAAIGEWRSGTDAARRPASRAAPRTGGE